MVKSRILFMLTAYNEYQGYGFGSGLDPDEMTLWIRKVNAHPDTSKCRVLGI
jgi:hypothetical protein